MTKKAINFATIGLGLTFIFALIAELFRFKGYLILDLWVPIFVTGYLIFAFAKGNLKRPKTLLPAGLFLIFGFSSLLINSTEMSTAAFFEAAIYGVRWSAYYLLCVITLNETKQKDSILIMLIIFGLLLSIGGFIQLKIAPDFTAFESLGWDPHQGRLLSTWFDPNFVGGFLAFLLPIMAGIAFDKKHWIKYLAPLSLIMLTALILTLSRSAYLAFFAGIFVVGVLRSWKLILIASLASLVLLTISPQVQNRVGDLTQSLESVFTETYTLPDASARLRFGSWDEAWTLFKQKPLIGHGYNAYSAAAIELGTVKDADIHSATGSDSSLLTILATTGILGFIPFISIYIILVLQAWRTRKKGYSVGFLGALVGLFIHSIFVNSLLFPLFLAPFWISVGLLEDKKSIKLPAK